MKELFDKKQGGAWGEEAKENENDRVCIRVADFDFERQTVKEGQKTVRNYNADVISKLQIQGNELLIEKSGGGEKTPVGRSILTDGLEGNLYANFIDKLPIKRANCSKYVAYYMKALYQNNIVMPYIKQTTGIQNLDLESLLFEIIIVPSQYIEQQQIADYLDQKCAEIDKLIELQESMIEKLKEYKQSVITHAVTKGLDPDVPMKDSGIEWIGKIPEGWATVQLKNMATVYNGKEIENEIDYDNNAIEVYGSGGVFKYTDKYLYDGTAVLFGRKGSIGKPILVKNKQFWAVDTMYYSVPKVNANANYLYYMLIIFQWDLFATKTALPSIVATQVFNSVVMLPPLEEQHQIADYLDKKCAEIDNLIELKEQKIDKLKEYKKSLIYEYVTGKKEVC